MFEDAFAEFFIGKKSDNIAQFGVFHLQESEEGVAQEMLESGAPGVFVELVENGNNARSNELAVLDVATFKKVNFDGAVTVGRVEKDNVVDAAGGNVVKESIDGIAVRINETEAFIVAQIIDGHVTQHRGFTGAGFSDDIHMTAAIGAVNAVFAGFVFKDGFGKNVDFFFDFWWILFGDSG